LRGQEKVDMEAGEDVVGGLIPIEGYEEDVVEEQQDVLNMSTNTAVRHIVSRNASFITLTAGALATTKGGARSAVIAEASTNVKRLNSR
jgi:hypothetical protein